MRFVIVGAGVAGSIMARMLSRLPDVEVICLERVAADDQSESGTGLNVCPNAVQVMRAHDAPLAESITAASLPWQNWRVSLTDGTVLLDLPLLRVANHEGWRIRWSELYRMLRSAAPNIRYGCTITGLGRDPQDSTKSFVEWTQDGTSKRLDAIDLLIATDGRYSQIRQTFSGAPEQRFVGVAISRVLVPDTSGGLVDDYEQWFNGPNRLLAYRVPPDHIYVAAAFPIPADTAIPDRLKQPDALREAFTPPAGSLTAQTRWVVDTVCTHGPDMHWARMQDHAALYSDPQSHVLYLGDAAHGMVPTLAQGATQAIEDAYLAADVITRGWQTGCHDPRQWLQAIEALRQDRMQFAMAFSVEATDTILEGAEPVAGTLHKTKPEFLAKLHRLYCDVPEPQRPMSGSASTVGRLTA